MYFSCHALNVVKSVVTAISTLKTTILKFGSEKLLRNFRFKRGNQYFKMGVGKKRGGAKLFQNSKGGTKALLTVPFDEVFLG